MTAVLRVSTPEGGSGRILSSGGDYLFRCLDSASRTRDSSPSTTERGG